ncbi:MAG: V-type ATP synthase subunit I [Chlamydiota bacterium]
MAIIQLKKYLFVGVREDLDTFFHRAQEKGVLEFISRSARRSVELPEGVRKIIQALKILRKLPAAVPIANATQVDLDQVAAKVVQIKGQIEHWLEEQRLLEAEIARIAPLGNFSVEELRDLEKTAHRHFQFFCVKKAKSEHLPKSDTLIYLNSDYDLDYFLSISPQSKRFPGMIEMHLDRSLSQLQQEKSELQHSIEQAQGQLKRLTAYKTALQSHLIKELNRYHLGFAMKNSDHYLEGSLFAVEAWIPSSRLHALFPLLDGIGVHAEEIAIEEGERVPTYMENKNYGAVGEDLVHIYDTPAPEDRDPSKWVFWSFVIFFAMIISDAGYGALYLILALLIKWKFPRLKGTGRRFVKLMTAISISCIGWGILSGAYFGIEFAPSNPVNKASLIHYLAVKKADYHVNRKDLDYQEWVKRIPNLATATTGEQFLANGVVMEKGRPSYKVFIDFSDSVFLELALVVGIIHISLSLLRSLRRHYAGIGWVLAAVGGYLYFPQVLQSTSLLHFLAVIPPATAYAVGWQLLVVGIGLAILLALVQNRWRGFIEISKPIELFADILSYLRLYALGLAGMTLATTFNTVARDVGGVFGFGILICGHITNITVGIMGGTIHGLRLNFIEWYHHSFEGGGRLFHPLKLLKAKGE